MVSSLGFGANLLWSGKIDHIDFLLLNSSMDSMTVYMSNKDKTLNVSYLASYNGTIVTVKPRQIRSINNVNVVCDALANVLGVSYEYKSFSFDACDIKRSKFKYKVFGLEFLNEPDYA